MGAGLAGIAAADSLINRYNFKNVTVYEAADYTGGRIKAVHKDNLTYHLGAQYLHHDNNDLYRYRTRIYCTLWLSISFLSYSWAEEAKILDGPENDEDGRMFIDGKEAPADIERFFWNITF